jgi:hypothetical protein
VSRHQACGAARTRQGRDHPEQRRHEGVSPRPWVGQVCRGAGGRERSLPSRLRFFPSAMDRLCPLLHTIARATLQKRVRGLSDRSNPVYAWRYTPLDTLHTRVCPLWRPHTSCSFRFNQSLRGSQSSDRRMADVLRAGSLGERLAVRVATERLALLVGWGVRFGRRPRRTPRAFARARPSLVRARISARANSASSPRTVRMRRPCGVMVSAQASPRDVKPAPLAVMVANVLSRSRVLRARRSSRVTISTSPAASLAST